MREVFFRTIILGMIMLMGCAPRTDILSDPTQNPTACALFVARRIISDSEKCDRLSDIAIICAEAGQKGNASKILSEAYKSSKLVKKTWRSYPMSRVAVKYAQVGEKDKAITILSKAYKLTKRNKNPIAMSYVATKYAELEQEQKACKILAKAFHLVDGYAARETREAMNIKLVSGARRRKLAESLGNAAKSRALVEIAAGYAEIGQYPKAFEIAKMIEEDSHNVKNISPNVKYIANVLIKIAATYAKAGEKDKAAGILPKAYQLIISMKKEGPYGEYLPDGSLLDDIAIIYTEVGQYDQALRICETKEQFYGGYTTLKARTLANIAMDYAKAGQEKKALKALSEALQSAKNMKPNTFLGPGDQAETLAEIGAKFAQIGKRDKAFEIMSQAFELAKLTKGRYWKESEERIYGWQARHYSEIALSCAESGEKEKALEILSEALQTIKKVTPVGDPEGIVDKAEILALIAIRYAQAELEIDNSGREILREIVKESKRIKL